MRSSDTLESLNITIHDTEEGVGCGSIFVFVDLRTEFPSLARLCRLR